MSQLVREFFPALLNENFKFYTFTLGLRKEPISVELYMLFVSDMWRGFEVEACEQRRDGHVQFRPS